MGVYRGQLGSFIEVGEMMGEGRRWAPAGRRHCQWQRPRGPESESLPLAHKLGVLFRVRSPSELHHDPGEAADLPSQVCDSESDRGTSR
jgi:hypothetical protein